MESEALDGDDSKDDETSDDAGMILISWVFHCTLSSFMELILAGSDKNTEEIQRSTSYLYLNS